MYAPWADQVHDQLQLLKMDVRFLAAFCDCLKTWDYSTDEESKERLRSMITTLTEIWPKEHKGLSLVKRLDETCPIRPMDMSIQDFYSAKFELEAKIQQSKQQVGEVQTLCICHYTLCILRSCNLQPSDFSLVGDFFFEHLATILKDDFLVLRDRLILLFTLLADATCENVEEEEDQIRSQIVALLREDAFHLSTLDKIIENLSDKKLLQKDCMMKIDIASTKIRQLFSV